jgi:uncharacterized membrane protein YdjX (TVP38/TMEM64 family)
LGCISQVARITLGDGASQWCEGPFPPFEPDIYVLARDTARGVPMDVEAASDGKRVAVSWLKRLWPLLLLLAAGGFIYAIGLHRYLSIETLVDNRQTFRTFIRANMVLSLGVFVAVYATAVALSLPGGAALTMAGGFLFGWLLGGTVSIVAATIGASIAFLIARSALGDLLAARAGPWLSRFRQEFQEDAFSYLLFLRLVPIFPFWLVNLAPGLLGVSFPTYVATTILGIIPGTFAFALAGYGLDSVIEAQQAAYQSCLAKMGPGGQESCSYTLDAGALLTPELIAGLVALGLVALIPVGVKWYRRTRA